MFWDHAWAEKLQPLRLYQQLTSDYSRVNQQCHLAFFSQITILEIFNSALWKSRNRIEGRRTSNSQAR